MPKPSAAQALYPHLRQGTPNEVAQRHKPNSTADAIFPALSREAKQREADQRLWDSICKRNREITLRNLRAQGTGALR
jgi:hypothetical protein